MDKIKFKVDIKYCTDNEIKTYSTVICTINEDRALIIARTNLIYEHLTPITILNEEVSLSEK